MSIAIRLYNKLILKGLSLRDARVITEEAVSNKNVEALLELHGRTANDDKPEDHRIEVLVWVLADRILAAKRDS